MSLSVFLDSIKSEETRKHYSLYLQKYFEFAGSDFDNSESKIIQFISELKKKGKSHGGIQNYLAPIKLYYSIHDVTLNIKKIDRFLPEQRKQRKDRAYTHDEISKLLQICDERMKVVILLLASSGIRIGSIANLRIRHLQDNKLIVYEGDREEYLTFLTPECQKAIDNYIDMRSRYGKK